MEILMRAWPLLLLAPLACAPAEPEPDPPEPCVYPEASDPFAGIGDVMPRVVWQARENGEPLELDLEQVYCGEQLEEFDSLFFVLVAEWCPECPEYSELVGSLADELEFNGAKPIFVDMETRDFELPTIESAENYVNNYTDKGIRVGEADAEPAGFITNAEDDGLWEATPNAFFLRKSDMSIVVRQQDSTEFILPMVKIAQGLDLDWSDPDNPPFVNNCASDGDEDSEPNDTVAQAAPLSSGDVVEGGICNAEPDFYEVDIEGGWRLDLEFAHFTANVDVFEVDEAGEIKVTANNLPLGSDTRTDDEIYIGNGPTTLMVIANDDRSAPYRLEINGL
jgi:thiol-disulfide isomerase/thioredoxin